MTEADRKRLRPLIHVGARMANLCFNWKQMKVGLLDDHRLAMDKYQSEWDQAWSNCRELFTKPARKAAK